MSDGIATTVQCPECGKTYKMSNASPGKRARCRCGCQFEINDDTITGDDGTRTRMAEISDEEALAAVEKMSRAKEAILSEVGKIIVGQTDVLEQILAGFFAGGHCLLLGVPGLAKTLMVHSLSQTMHLDFKRIQFTPDLMPTDITGTNILEEDPDTHQRRFTFHKGPIFTNVLLADEINRTPPKTQAALLEAMQEHHVTTGGDTYKLPAPFLVLATQNPLELEGTYPLPEAQLDRFILLVKVDYPNLEQEQKILLSTTSSDGEAIKSLLDARAVTMYQGLVRRVPVSEHVANYAARLCRATRPKADDVPDFIKNYVRYGCGPRAGQSLLLSAKAHVVLNGRFNVSCEDIRRYALPVMRHGLDSDDIIKRLLETVPESESE